MVFTDIGPALSPSPIDKSEGTTRSLGQALTVRLPQGDSGDLRDFISAWDRDIPL